jgi:uncharacterized membrane protein
MLAGLAAFSLARGLEAPAGSRVLMGWVVGASIFLGLTWRLILKADEAEVRARAAEEDEPGPVLLLIVLAAVLAGLVAIVVALIEARAATAFAKALIAGLAGATLILSWVMLQTVFVIHYAHRHFATGEKGFGFPGEPAKTYLDFVYLSFCIGATFQVSDNTVNTSALRNLITAHAAVAYLFNTAILALGINIIAGLVG